MSLSDNAGGARMGRVIYGLQSRRLDEIDREAASSVRVGTQEDEQKFLLRVKQKAMDKASSILNQALEDAVQIRDDSFRQGYAEGLKKAGEEIEKQKKDLTQQFEKILTQMQKEKKAIYDRHREDLVMVMLAGLEKVVGYKIQEDYVRIMDYLLLESLEMMEHSREITISVNEKDQDLVKELLEKVVESRPEYAGCRIKASKKIKQGGVVLESGRGMVDNTLDNRYSKVKELVDKVSLKEESS
ncbi:FliH/SctL family protein [Desulfonatronospira sp.]|uniref:FliH/SctL family protein n=1 Tax=Desulfonatronospira sp. TaxID=1962951 RepID=UPI0025BEBD12|nr:FliH/SctL family protein [Desulfonatronospira sp.]